MSDEVEKLIWMVFIFGLGIVVGMQYADPGIFYYSYLEWINNA